MADRAEYIKGLRLIANLLADHDDLSLPYSGTDSKLTIFIEGPSPVHQALLFMQFMDAPTVSVDGRGSVVWADVRGRIAGVDIILHLRAEEVCGRRIVSELGEDGVQRDVVKWMLPAELRPAVPVDLADEPADRAPALDLPQIAVACPMCGAPAGELCTSHGGTRVRTHNTHLARTNRWANSKDGDQ